MKIMDIYYLKKRSINRSKCIKVISSCETLLQLSAADRMACNYVHKLLAELRSCSNNISLYKKLHELYLDDKNEFQKIYSLKRKQILSSC